MKINKFIAVIVFGVFIFSCLSVYSQKRKTNKKPNTDKRVVLIEKKQPEDGIWKEIVSEKGNFKVLFPKEPEKTIRDKDGKVGNYFTDYKLETNFRTYSVSFGDFNFADSISDKELGEIYNKIRDNIINNSGGKILNDTNFFVGNVKGRELVYEQGNYLFTNRILLRGKKFYQIITSVEKELNIGTNVQEFARKFLDSFKFIK